MKRRIARKNIKVISAKIISPFVVKIGFNDRTKQIIDFGKWIKENPNEAHDYLLDESVFQKEMIIDHGDLYWGDNMNLGFPTLNYYHSDLDGNYD